MEIVFENYSIAPIQPKDAWRLCDFVVSNEAYLKTYFPETLKENLTPTLAELFVAKKAKQFDKKQEYLFVAKENTNRTIIGLVYIKSLHREKGQGELAYCMGYQYSGKGLMSSIVQELIQWSFATAGLLKLQIIVHKSNGPSIKIAEKHDFQYMGILTNEHRMPNGDLVDMLLYELNKSDFLKSP